MTRPHHRDCQFYAISPLVLDISFLLKNVPQLRLETEAVISFTRESAGEELGRTSGSTIFIQYVVHQFGKKDVMGTLSGKELLSSDFPDSRSRREELVRDH